MIFFCLYPSLMIKVSWCYIIAEHQSVKLIKMALVIKNIIILAKIVIKSDNFL